MIHSLLLCAAIATTDVSLVRPSTAYMRRWFL